MEQDGPRQRAAETKRRRTRQALIDAVIELLSDDNYLSEQVGVDAIVEQAGVSSATLYNHFKSRQELITAAYEHLMSPVTDPILEAWRVDAYHVTNVPLEVERYLTNVARLACQHRRLTAELMIGWLSTRRYTHDQPGQRLAQALNNVSYASSGPWISRSVDIPATDAIALLLVNSSVFGATPEDVVARLKTMMTVRKPSGA
jgi:AcrR family transcriptional regulator